MPPARFRSSVAGSCGPDRADGERGLVAVRFRVCDQRPDVCHRAVLGYGNRQRRLGNEGDRREVLLDRVGNLVHGHRRRDERRRIEEQRVAVGRRLRHGVGADNAVAPGPVFDDERLPKASGRQLLRHRATKRIERSAGREQIDHPDCPVGLRLRRAPVTTSVAVRRAQAQEIGSIVVAPSVAVRIVGLRLARTGPLRDGCAQRIHRAPAPSVGERSPCRTRPRAPCRPSFARAPRQWARPRRKPRPSARDDH